MDSADTAPTPLQALMAERYAGRQPQTALAAPMVEALLAHRSVRGFSPDPVPQDAIALAMAAAQSAATSSNLQTWSVVTVTDPARKERLKALASNQKQIAQAPLLMVWLADLSRLRAITGPSGVALDYLEMFLMATIDATLAAQNAVAAFEAMGWGTCYIGAMRNNPREVAAELALPPETFAVFGLCVGRPAPGAEGAVKPRLPQPVVCHAEQYGQRLPEGPVARYDADMLAFQAEQGMGDVAWTARCADRVGSLAALNNRDTLRAQLEAMGFGLK
jgi:nitroreductase